MRIAFISNSPWTPSGYGQQLKIVAPRLQSAGHELSIQAFHGHQGSPINWNGIPIYGGASHPYGQDVMAAHADNFKADIIMSNMDSWVIEPSMMFNQKWVAWFPVDSEPCPPLVIEKVKQAFHRIVWTEFAKKEMDKVGLDYDYIPYGVDIDVFRPMDKTESRNITKMPQDKFIVGMVAMNKGYPPRKAFYQNIEAFKLFHDKHADSMLYLHTLDGSRPNGESIDLIGFCQMLGLKIGEDVIFADQYSYLQGYPDTAVATLYNCMDVHLLVSMGEVRSACYLWRLDNYAGTVFQRLEGRQERRGSIFYTAKHISIFAACGRNRREVRGGIPDARQYRLCKTGAGGRAKVRHK
jgi:hypothetical protein